MAAMDELTPPQQLRVVLAECRRRQMTFDRAWWRSLRVIPPSVHPERDEWIDIFEDHWAIWKAGYERRSLHSRASKAAPLSPSHRRTARRLAKSQAPASV